MNDTNKLKKGFTIDDLAFKEQIIHNSQENQYQHENKKTTSQDNQTLKAGFTLDKSKRDSLYEKAEIKVNEEGSSMTSTDDEQEQEEMPQTAFYSSPVFWGMLLVLALASCQTYAYVYAAFTQSSIMGTIVAIGFLVVFFMLLYTTYKEFGAVLLLKESDKTREEIKEIKERGKAKDALVITKKLARLTRVSDTKYNAFAKKIAPNFLGKEVIDLYESELMVNIDKRAVDLVIKRSAENGVVVALSPLAWLDMLFTLMRSLKMIREISEIYGHKCGMWGRVQLYRRVFKNLIFIGMSDLATDALLDIIGTNTLKRLSANLAQGISAAIFSTRLGYMAIKAVRPITPGKNTLSLGMLRKGVLTHPKIKQLIFGEGEREKERAREKE